MDDAATPAPTATDIVQRAARAAFGAPLVTNVFRGTVVEAIVDAALAPEWVWCSQDYSSWDFEHRDGTRLEVKQSAARQSWTPSCTAIHVGKPNFDIAARQGRWEGPIWVGEPGRASHIYVFAHHPVADRNADHRDPLQWDFYVVGAGALPPGGKTLGLAGVKERARATPFAALRAEVERVRTALQKDRSAA